MGTDLIIDKVRNFGDATDETFRVHSFGDFSWVTRRMGLMELPFFEPDNDCRPYTGESLPRIHLVSSVIPKDLAEFQRGQLWWAGRKMSQRSKAVCYVPGHEFVVDYEITIIDHTKLDLEEEREDRIADVILAEGCVYPFPLPFSFRARLNYVATLLY